MNDNRGLVALHKGLAFLQVALSHHKQVSSLVEGLSTAHPTSDQIFSNLEKMLELGGVVSTDIQKAIASRT